MRKAAVITAFVIIPIEETKRRAENVIKRQFIMFTQEMSKTAVNAMEHLFVMSMPETRRKAADALYRFITVTQAVAIRQFQAVNTVAIQ